VAAAVIDWLARGRRVAFARVAELHGIGAAGTDELLALSDNGDTAGTLLAGLVAEPVEAAAGAVLAPGGPTMTGVDVAIDHARADAAGLSCGGSVRVLVQAADAVPRELWQALAADEPVVLATMVPAAGAAGASWAPGSIVVGDGRRTAGSLGEADLDRGAREQALQLLQGGNQAGRVVEIDGVTVRFDALVPRPRLLVIGPGHLADAIRAQARLLGWDARVAAGADDGLDGVSWAGRNGAVVVLSHDGAIDGPVLAEALGVGTRYVGALGSRRTQAARAARLRQRGVSDGEVARVRGPAGLDLGGSRPAEVALAICAEIQSVRSGRDASALRDGDGPIRIRPG
jgi:xanthine dehydrogenase accessory factor